MTISPEKMQAVFLLADNMSATGLDGFLRWWVIDSAPPSRFASMARPFQLDRMMRLRQAIEQVAGVADYDGPRAFWEIAARGFDKSGSIGRIISWAVAYSRYPIEVVIGAGDQDQASIIYDAAKRECELNPWIKPRIQFKTKRIIGVQNGSMVKILTADAPSSYGLRPDLIICDELTWWESRALWDALFTARQKRPKCVLSIISNAGVLRTWQHDLYMGARSNPGWVVWDTDPLKNPTWMSAEGIENDKKLLPRSIARRLYDNIWIDPSEEAGYLLRSEIEACLRQGAEPHRSPQPMCQYVLSVDYGPRRDRTVLSLLHQDPEGVCWVDECHVLQGSYDWPVKIADVEAWLDEKLDLFPSAGLIVDPYQLEGTVQRFMERTQVTRFQARGPVGNFHMAELLRTAILSQRLLWAPGTGRHPTAENDDFTSELSNLIIKQMPSGKYRFDHEVGQHDDRAVSVGMGLVALHEGYIPRPHLVPEPVRSEQSRSRSGLLVADRSRRLFGISDGPGRSKR